MAPGNIVYHVLNRANGRISIFQKPEDFEAFEAILVEAKEECPMRILAYCLMPNHWHLVLYPARDGDLSRFMHWLTSTHAKRWRAHRETVGEGHLYQDRFRSFPVETDTYFLQLCRYVERNPLRANLVRRAEEWHWSSLWRREYGKKEQRELLSPWPVDRPATYLQWVNEQQLREKDTVRQIRDSIQHGRPYGRDQWSFHIAKQQRLETTFRKRGRPKMNQVHF